MTLQELQNEARKARYYILVRGKGYADPTPVYMLYNEFHRKITEFETITAAAQWLRVL